jgi:cyclic-di-GMP phosphodiesterase TipF (flagellum assembly factor)
MGFLSSSVVVVAMTVVASCLGALAYLVLGLDLDTSAVLSLAAFGLMIVLQLSFWRGEDRRVTSRGFEDVNRSIDRIARECTEISRRLSAVEGNSASISTNVVPALRTEIETLRGDLGELAALVAEQAEQSAQLVAQQVAPPAAAPSLSAPVSSATASGDDGARRGRFASLPRPERTAMVAEAIEAGRIELLLQPIVTLPQRKVRWYEVLARLKSEFGEVMLPDDVAPIAAEGGLSARLDRELVLRSVQLLRRLQTRNRDAGLMLDIAPASLAAGTHFGDIVDFLRSNESLASSFVLEVPQQAYRNFGPIELEAMSAIGARGFKFALDNARDLRVDGRELADRAFRFIKTPADVILGKGGDLPADIHPADITGFLARFGIDLIADRIDAEATVVDLLDYEIRFGQGHLFSPPRPVRADVLGPEPAPVPARRAAS